ncbi:MAG: VWA domain-containing protein [Pseudomonadota bacterium]|nr:VWA domain-containing protein [Pseudomonadota bacterium]
MTLALAHPWVLALLPLAFLPFFFSSFRSQPYPWVEVIPRDVISTAIDYTLRVIAALAIASLILGIAGLHRVEQTVQRIGRGAHTVLLLDRSSSMDHSFAGHPPSGEEESKAQAARRLLLEFVARRKSDLIGVASFSTSAMFVLPLSEHREAIEAAIRAMDTPGLGLTNIAKGLAMALSFFQGRPYTGSRVIVLVSDGATEVDHRSRADLRKWFKELGVGLYWIYLRTANSPGIFEARERPPGDTADGLPERHLHAFLSSLETPYSPYEAENPQALERAIADLDALENLPLRYSEHILRGELSGWCYGLALCAIAALLGAKLAEVRAWR